MQFQTLTLYTNTLETEKEFYTNTLGFDLKEEEQHYFSIQIGSSVLRFEKSEQSHTYHYCFLIPCNQLQDAVAWLKDRLPVLEIEPGRFTEPFESWNAAGTYFYDGSGNIAECIVRYDLENESKEQFGLSSFLCLNEIGLASDDIPGVNQKLGETIGTSLWSGNMERFATHGSQNGLFLLPNYNTKTTWFPTDLKVEPVPFKAVVMNEGKEYSVEYTEEELSIKRV
ncbi:MAG: VOC family protein [Bacteroidia bacterium]